MIGPQGNQRKKRGKVNYFVISVYDHVSDDVGISFCNFAICDAIRIVFVFVFYYFVSSEIHKHSHSIFIHETTGK